MTQRDWIQNRYRIERLLGTGGFARVYLAHDERLGRRVAVKELSTSTLDEQEQQTAIALFEREARMLAQLDHPGLTNIWDYFHYEDRAFLVMEYVPGPTLRELVLNHGGPLPELLVIACGLQLCDVLAYLHSRTPPIIFRDLKPGNVIVEELAGMPTTVENLSPDTLQIKLIDFGIARLFKPEQSSDTMIVGTPGYASPEQYGQGQTDARSDIYSLGATLHHLASGSPPNGLLLPPLLDVNPAASPALARVIARATALKPEDRYQSIDLMRRDLLALREGIGQVPPPALTPRPTVPLHPPSRIPAPNPTGSPVLIGVLALVILAVVGLGALAVGAIGRERGQGSPSPRPAGTTATAQSSNSPSAVLPGASGRLLYGQCTNISSGACNIYQLDMGNQARSLVVGGSNNTASTLSPDGKQIAVTKNGVIYIGTIDNPLARQISATGAPSRYPAFSPDGQQLAYVTTQNGDQRLVITNLVNNETTAAEPNFAQYGAIFWSKQGLTYAAAEARGQAQDIFLRDANGNSRNLTNTPDVEEEFPSWSPDGRSLLFTASPAGPNNLSQRQIFRTDAQGKNRTQLTSGQGPHTNAVWSPDGKWVAYASQAGGSYQTWAMHADGSDARQISSGNEGKFYLFWAK